MPKVKATPKKPDTKGTPMKVTGKPVKKPSKKRLVYK